MLAKNENKNETYVSEKENMEDIKEEIYVAKYYFTKAITLNKENMEIILILEHWGRNDFSKNFVCRNRA